jgi:hypothetical protein
MRVHGDYAEDGYAMVERLVAPDVAKALLDRLLKDVADAKIAFSFSEAGGRVTSRAAEMHGGRHPMLTAFAWGLTPAVAMLTGSDLLPTYCYFRMYREKDRLRVHADRDECEHSVSLTLGYSDSKAWAFDISQAQATDRATISDSFDGEPNCSLVMHPGDAVMYRGIDRRHGRVTPNPNRWSGHLFLHWVDANGPFRERAFEDPR